MQILSENKTVDWSPRLIGDVSRLTLGRTAGLSPVIYSGEVVRIGVAGVPWPLEFTADHMLLSTAGNSKSGLSRPPDNARRMLAARQVKSISVRDWVSFSPLSPEIDLDWITGDIARLIGLYVAEGHASKDHHQIVFGFHQKEALLADFVLATVLTSYGVHGTKKLDAGKHCLRVRFCNTELCKLFEAFGSRLAWNKSLHPTLMVLPAAKQFEILKGWLEGDGHWRNKSVVYGYTTSQDLAKQMLTIAMRCGINARAFSVLRKNRRPSWTLSFPKSEFRAGDSKNIIRRVQSVDRFLYTGIAFANQHSI